MGGSSSAPLTRASLGLLPWLDCAQSPGSRVPQGEALAWDWAWLYTQRPSCQTNDVPPPAGESGRPAVRPARKERPDARAPRAPGVALPGDLENGQPHRLAGAVGMRPRVGQAAMPSAQCPVEGDVPC